jgi:hypothetical protein
VITPRHGEDFANFILCAIGHISHQKFNEIFKPTDDDFDLSLTFNGVELPIQDIFEDWVNQKKFDVNRRAADMLVERMDSFMDEVRSTQDIIEEEINDLKNKMVDNFNLSYNSFYNRVEEK